MALEPGIGLVGREDTAALIDLLLRRRSRQPLPVVVAFGPGGGGKTALLDHVQRRYRELPIARVDLARADSSLSCPDILQAIFEDLRSFSHPRFGRIRLLRYALAHLALSTEPDRDDQNPARAASDLVTRKMTNLDKAAVTFAAAADLIPMQEGVAKLLKPLFGWLVRFGVSAPVWLRWLLVGPSVAAMLRWYEREAIDERLLDLPKGCKTRDAVTRIWKMKGDQEEDELKRLDRLLVAAFLADIAHVLRSRRRRRVNCVLLLDGADLLEPFTHSLFAGNRGELSVPRSNFLELLAEERLTARDVPLLVVATKQAMSGIPEPPRDPDEDPVREARQRYERWLHRFQSATNAADAYFSVRLRPFTLEQTAQFVAEWSREQDTTVVARGLLDELHQVTKGHPLAVRLAVQGVDGMYRRDLVRPSVRAVFDEPAFQWEPAAGAESTVGDYLLLRFLQRFRSGEDVEERQRTKELLARLAAPRRLDVGTIRQLVPYRDAKDTFDRLSHYSFAELTEENGERRLTLHPLLRDLLARDLLERSEPGDGPYQEVHATLRRYYEQQDGERRSALYHTLALGDVATVVNALRPLIADGRPNWPAMLDEITEAPVPEIAPAPRRRWLRALFDNAPGVHPPAVLAVRRLVRDTWSLRSCTSTTQRTSTVYYDIARGYREVAERAANGNGQPARTQEEEYNRLARIASEGAPTSTVDSLPDFCAARQKVPFPRVPFSPKVVRRSAVGVVALVIAGYVTGYAMDDARYCGSPSVLDPAGVVGTWFDPSLSLAKTTTGECVGITDRLTRYVYGANADPTGDSLETGDLAEVGELSRLIYQENQRVTDQVGTAHGLPYVTIVVATMLSTANQQPYRDLSAGVNELRGAYLAQRNWNQLDTSNVRPPFLLRIDLANLGGNSQSATEVAARIQRLADEDPTVLAVTGLGQTRDPTIDAATTLGTPTASWSGIPMVFSAANGDTLAGKDFVYLTAAANQRESEVGVDFLTSNPVATGRGIYLVYDPNDSYSNDLYLRYQAELKLAGTKTYDATQNDTGPELANDVQGICQSVADTGRPPLVLYAGRANELPTLMTQLRNSSCGPKAIVFGDDDLTQVETEGYQDLQEIADFADRHLYFTSLAPLSGGWPDLVSRTGVPGQVLNRVKDNQNMFFFGYQRLAGQEKGIAYRTPPNGHIMLAYDAVGVTLDAIGRAGMAAGRLPTRPQVNAALKAVHGYPGVSGPMSFDSTGRSGGYDPDKLVTVEETVLGPQGTLRSVDVYGEY